MSGEHPSRVENHDRDLPRGRLVTLGALAGVVGPALFAMLVVVGGALYDGYSHTSQKISELGGQGADLALLQNANFVLSGLLVAWFAWALGHTFGPPYRGPALVGAFGVSSFVANGLGGISQRVFVGALLAWIARTAWLLHRHLTVLEPTPPVDQPSAA